LQDETSWLVLSEKVVIYSDDENLLA